MLARRKVDRVALAEGGTNVKLTYKPASGFDPDLCTSTGGACLTAPATIRRLAERDKCDGWPSCRRGVEKDRFMAVERAAADRGAWQTIRDVAWY